MYTHVYTSTYMCGYMYEYMCMSIYMTCTCICFCMCMCMYVYVYVYVYVYSRTLGNCSPLWFTKGWITKPWEGPNHKSRTKHGGFFQNPLIFWSHQAFEGPDWQSVPSRTKTSGGSARNKRGSEPSYP